tara:strand:+ start:1495 stop:1983 length:489 start_codon:yes stop_codon:yes gene_type:complete
MKKKNIREYLKYDSTSSTGLRWIKSPSHKCKEGDEAFTSANKGYYCGIFDYVMYSAHQVIMFLQHGKWSDRTLHIDHINGDKTNNNIDNLRFVSPTGNQKNDNRKMQSNNTSGIKGIDYNWSSFRARYYVNGKQVSKSSKDKQVCIDWLNEMRQNDEQYIMA